MFLFSLFQPKKLQVVKKKKKKKQSNLRITIVYAFSMHAKHEDYYFGIKKTIVLQLWRMNQLDYLRKDSNY